MKLREWNAHLHGLVVFRALLNDPVVARLLDLTDRMEAGSTSYGPVCDAVAAFEAALFEYTTNWGSYLSSAVLEAETICVRQAAAGQLDALLQSALDSELQFLQQLCGLTLDDLFQTAYSEQAQRPELAFLPRWQTCELDLAAAYAQRMSEVGKKGYGMFAKHHVFTVENGQLVPVKYPDPQRLSELPGYEKEREKVIANTKALLAGMPANNVLLYGDAGTGKSSSVKAIANDVNATLLGLGRKFYGIVGTPGTTPFSTVVDATNARKVLNRQLAPVNDRRIVLDPDAEAAALGLSGFADVSKSGDARPIIDGTIGRKYGFDWAMDQQVPTLRPVS